MINKVVKSRAFKDRLKGHKDTIISLISPYGQQGGVLLSASKDGQIRVWDLVQRQITAKLLLSRWPNETTVYDQEQKDEEVIQLINNQGNEGKKIIKDSLSAATFNERNVYGGYEDGFISSWNLKTGETLYSYKGHENEITQLKFYNIRILISSSLDGTIRMWDTSSGTCEIIIRFGLPINYIKLIDDTIQILYNKNTIAELNAKVSFLYNFISIIQFFTSDNKKINENKTMQLKQPIQFPSYSITSFLIHQNLLVMGTVDNNIYVYNLNEFQQEQNQQMHLEQNGIEVSIRPDIKPLYIIEGNQGWALCMDILDRYIYVGTDERKIRVYNLKNWQLVEEFMGHDDGITQIAFADNMLYSGSFDHSIRSWELKDMHNRIRERAIMLREDLMSKRIEVYNRALPKKKKTKVKSKKK